MNKILLKTENLTKIFAGRAVLHNVSLELPPGTILGLVGENGAGKSTFVKCITGLYRPDGGKVTHSGGISAIPQEFNLIPELSVAENVFLGREPLRFGFLNRSLMGKRTAELLQKLHTEISPFAATAELNVAEKQMVEIAKALSEECSLLIMDEPTTVLNGREAEILFRIMRELKESGKSIIFISHRLDEVCTVCDRVAVLRDGELVHDSPLGDLKPADLARMMVGRELSRLFPPQVRTPAGAPEVLRVEHLTSGKAVQDVSFSLKKGSVTGLAGLAGAGRTELAEAICGLRQTDRGELYLSGEKIRIASYSQAVKHGIVYLPEDRQKSGILPDFPLNRNITLASLKKYCTSGIIHRKDETEAAEKYVNEFHIRSSSVHAPAGSLSGGNQQKAIIAKCLDTEPEIFLFDEPTRGVDIGARLEIYEFIASLASAGMTCLIISSDLDEIIGMCPRVLVMRAGKLSGKLSGNEITQENIMFAATGVTNS